MPNRNILLIDDDIEDYLILKEAFADLGVEKTPIHVDSAQNAMDFLERQCAINAQLPDLMILDINMPLTNGLVLLQKLRSDSRFSSIPIVVYSTMIVPADHQRCQELGVEHCIIKPCDLDDVLKISEMFLALCDNQDSIS